MCGIVGIVADSRDSPEELRASARRMSGAVAHRGPDDWGMMTLHGDQIEHRSMTCPEGHVAARIREASREQTVVLAHRRLAIIDLSANGHQPMGTVDGRYWIIYNGEIYNYRELRSELESGGVTFRSTSDTEVLLALYTREGPRCLQRLRGMFAFAVWDERAGELFLARDRFGMKPLYYAQGGHGLFLFSSELKALLLSGFCSTDSDRDAEGAFLARGSIRAPGTIYRDIKALEPAHWARWDGSALSGGSYWSLHDVPAARPAHRPDIRDVAASVRQGLTESVHTHMVSDVPVGVFLSGGVDSTAILAAVRQFSTGPLTTFTLAFPGTQWDESGLARQAASQYGTNHVELHISREDFYKGLDEFFPAMDQPTVDGVNTFFVAKLASQAGVKVALSGLGGDELLGGYQSFVDVPRLLTYLRAVEQIPGLSLLASSLARYLPVSWAPKLAQIIRETPYSVETLWRDCRALFTDDEVRTIEGVPVAASRLSRSGCKSDIGAFRSISCLEIEQFMIPQLLRDSDAFTMCHGLELRTPFVDHQLLAAVARAGTWSRDGAPSYKIALLRQMGGFLPAEHLLQPKRGFTLPFEVWLRHALSDQASSGIGREMRAFLDKPCYRPVVNGFHRGKVHWSRVWALYVLERFRATPPHPSRFPDRGRG